MCWGYSFKKISVGESLHINYIYKYSKFVDMNCIYMYFVCVSAVTTCNFQHQSDAEEQVQHPTPVETNEQNINFNYDYQQTQIDNPSGRNSGINKKTNEGSPNRKKSEDNPNKKAREGNPSPPWSDKNRERRRSGRDFANGHDSRNAQDPKPSQRNSKQLIHQSSDGDLNQRAHRRNESDSRLGLLRRQHTDVALARRSDVYRNSKVELAFPPARAEVTASLAGEPVLTDFMAVTDEHQRLAAEASRGGEGGRGELRRQVSLDGDLNTTSSSSSAGGREPARHEWNQRREKTDVDLRRAELRSELEQWRVNAPAGRGREGISHPGQASQQVSGCARTSSLTDSSLQSTRMLC